MNKKVRFTIEIDKEIHKAFKQAAAEDYITMRMYVLRLLIEKLRKDKYIKVN